MSTMYGALENQQQMDALDDHHHHNINLMESNSNSRRRRQHQQQDDDTNTLTEQHEVSQQHHHQLELTSFSNTSPGISSIDQINIENDHHQHHHGGEGRDDDGDDDPHVDIENSEQDKSKFVRFLRVLWNWITHNLMLIMTVIGVVLGLIIGISLNVSAHGTNPTIEISQMTIDFLKLPGELFLRALNCLIVPLIVSSMVTSITSIVDTIKENDRPTIGDNTPQLDNSNNSNTTTIEPIGVSNSTINYAQMQKKKHRALMKMACITLSFYLMTTFIAVVTGLVMVNLIQPGKININQNNETTQSTPLFFKGNQASVNLQGEMYPIGGVLGVFTSDMILDTSINGTSNNSTGRDKSSYHQIISIIESFVPNNLIDAASNTAGGSVNVLGLIVFSIFFALVMLAVGEPAKPIIKIFNALNVIILKMVSFIICYAPIGIMFLIIWRCVKEKDLLQAMSQLALYIATVFSGLAFHSFITLTALYTILVRKNILKHLFAVFPALLTGMGTASSSATLPLTMKCCEERGSIQREVTSFVLPLGSTVNMDGTASYEAVAAIFIAQVLGIELSIGQMIIVAITATLASIGAAGIPEAGLVTLILVIESVGLPKESVGLILSVDWFLDRARTTVNIYGDTIAAGVVNRYVRFDEISTSLTNEKNSEKTRLV